MSINILKVLSASNRWMNGNRELPLKNSMIVARNVHIYTVDLFDCNLCHFSYSCLEFSGLGVCWTTLLRRCRLGPVERSEEFLLFGTFESFGMDLLCSVRCLKLKDKSTFIGWEACAWLSLQVCLFEPFFCRLMMFFFVVPAWFPLETALAVPGR